MNRSNAKPASPTPWGFLGVGSIRPAGWLKTQVDQELNGFAGNLPDLCREVSSDIFVDGRVTGEHWRHWWNGESEGKWIDGYTRLAHVSGDSAARARVAAYFERILQSADSDGYIGIYSHQWRSSGGVRPADLWTQGMLFLAMLAHHEATGDERILTAVIRAMDETMTFFDAASGTNPFRGELQQSQLWGHNVFLVEPLLWLHEIAGDRRYVDFAISCYERYQTGSIRWLEADGVESRLGDPTVPFIAHGAHTAVQLRIPLLLFRATGDVRWQQVYEVGFEKMQRYVGVTGTCKSDECIGSEDTDGVPFPESGYEYCTITEQLHSLHLAYAITRESRYADRAELIAFNSAQGARQHDGKGIAYVSADNQFDASLDSGSRYKYSPVHSDVAVCCNPSATRMIAHHISRAVLMDSDGITVGFYGALDVHTIFDAVAVDIALETSYPFENRVTVTVETSSQSLFSLRLRIPTWARSWTLTGVDHTSVDEDHIVVRREWIGAMSFSVDFEAEVLAHTAVDGTIALSHGSLVYALDIASVESVISTYPVAGFADVEYRAHGRPSWHLAFVGDKDEVVRSTEVVRTLMAPGQDPFADPPVKLQVRVLDAIPLVPEFSPVAEPRLTAELVPFGATRLRRTTFPTVATLRPVVPFP